MIKFWGVRGSTPISGPEFNTYGGHTSCVSVYTENNPHIIILDAGTGIVELGQYVLDQKIRTAHLLISHFHMDHIMGLPLFMPLHDPEFNLHIYSNHSNMSQFFAEVLFNPTLFPVKWQDVAATVTLHQVQAGDVMTLGSIEITTLHLNHPGGAMGYRLAHQHKTFCYLTDYEHDDGVFDQQLIHFMHNCDYAVCDATYHDHDYSHGKKGWGHSTNIRAAQLAKEAHINNLILFHHWYRYDDNVLNENVAQSQAIFKNTRAAHEGMMLAF